VDTGAIDRPGIYILDGKFRMSSSTTGARVEITADQITGYDSAGPAQFSLQARAGVASAGGGAVYLSASGLNFTGGSTTSHQIKWLDVSGDEICKIYAYESGTASVVYFIADGPDAGEESMINIQAEEVGGGVTQLQVISPNMAGYDAAGTIIGRIGGTSILQIKSHGTKVAGDMRLTDGKAAPSTEAGYAIIYVDSADGNLKVKFGDGTVTTIATD